MTINFNVLLDKDTDDHLCRMAKIAHLSKANIIRALIRARAQMQFARDPQCADGQSCRCPHAHIYSPQPGSVPPDPDRPL